MRGKRLHGSQSLANTGKSVGRIFRQRVEYFPDTCLDVAYIGQKSALTFEGCALTGFQFEFRKLPVLIFYIFSLSAIAAYHLPGARKLSQSTTICRIKSVVLFQQTCIASYAVDNFQLILSGGQLQVLVLRMNVDKSNCNLPQLLKICWSVVYKSSRPSSRQQFAAKDAHAVTTVESVFGKNCSSRRSVGQLKLGFYHALPAVVADCT